MQAGPLMSARTTVWAADAERKGRTFHPRPKSVAGLLYAWTRNPMYLGGAIALLGIAIGCALDWVPLLLVLSLPLVHYGIILREERYLEREFGDEYRCYRKKVPRYWWRLR